METLAGLSDKEFDQILDNMSKPDYDTLPPEEFFKILATIDAAIPWNCLRILKTGNWFLNSQLRFR